LPNSIICTEGWESNGSDKVKKLIIASVTLAALSIPALADPGNGQGWGQGNGGGQGHKTSGVPGPLVGAGLPFLAVGYGAYWLVRRYRRKSDAA
jgi:hypothetical protein